MKSRSIVLRTAMVLLVSAAVPAPLAYVAAPALAQESSDVAAALAADPTQLDGNELRQQIKTLRQAIKSRSLSASEREAAKQKMQALRKEQEQRRASAERAEGAGEASTQQAQEAGQDSQEQPLTRKERRKRAQAQDAAEEPDAEPETTQADEQIEQPASRKERRRQAQQAAEEPDAEPETTQADEQIEQPASRKERRRQAQEAAEEPDADADATQAGQKAEQPASRKERRKQARASADVETALGDARPASELDEQDLRQRTKALRRAVESGTLSGDQRSQANAKLEAYRQEIKNRRKNGQSEAAAGKRERQTRQQTEPTVTEEAQQQAPDEKAQALISDGKQPQELNEDELRKRLSETRQVLGTGKLPKDEERQLRQRLKQDRQALRQRVSVEEKQESASTGGTEVTTNVNVIIEQPAPRDQLSERDLNRRIRVLERAVKDQQLEQRKLEIATRILEEDRQALRERLKRQRERRREELRAARGRDELQVNVAIGFQPPPVIFAAEADYEAIEHQLVAPPIRRPQRAYRFEEIVANPDVRQAMPGIEVDTLNFDFGSSEVRPEEIDKLDRIAEVIERVVAVRPEEVFMIEGHTDAVGSDPANMALSQARADAVMDALLEFYAIDQENLRAVGLGERFLRIPTEEPEEENRRVTVRRITPLLTGQAD